MQVRTVRVISDPFYFELILVVCRLQSKLELHGHGHVEGSRASAPKRLAKSSLAEAPEGWQSSPWESE